MRAAAYALLACAAAVAFPAGPASAQETSPGAKAAPEGKDWSEHKGDIPFIIGREAGMKEAEFTGKPILFFYTATW